MKKIILFGCGFWGNIVAEIVEKFTDFEIIEIWDNNVNKQGMLFKGKYIVVKPHISPGENIILCSNNSKEMREELITKFSCHREQILTIDDVYELLKKRLIEKYSSSSDDEIIKIMEYLQNHKLDVFNGEYREKYENYSANIYNDEQRGLFYTFWKQKKMYFSRKYKDKETCMRYIRNLSLEQDAESPHCYFETRYKVNDNDIVMDVGAAEGLFALEVIDKAAMVYIVECDESWVEALQYTFEPYRDKVKIIPKRVGDLANSECTTIDEILEGNKLNYLKMDIEGAEIEALQGMQNTFLTVERITMAICTYHNSNDAVKLKHILKQYSVKTWFSRGYMFFPYGNEIKDEFRRGLIWGHYEKANKQ